MARVVIGLIVVGLTVYALTDCIGSDESERSGIPRGLWILMIVLLPVLGPLAWFFTRGKGRRARPTSSSGPVAPDDDPDFLWRLRREEERRRKQEDDDSK